MTAPRPSSLPVPDAEVLEQRLHDLNEAGEEPTIAGVDAEGRAFLAVLNEVGGDDVLPGLIWDNPHTAVYSLAGDDPCDHCGCLGRHPVPLTEAAYPATVLAAARDARLAQVPDGERSDLDGLAAENARLRAEHHAFTAALGFGDGVTEPAARLADLVAPLEQAIGEADEWREGPRLCGLCDEWLATDVCEPCRGSGYGPGTASGAYDECEHCAGIGKVHPGCVEKSYDDLVAEVRAQGAGDSRVVREVTALVERLEGDRHSCFRPQGCVECGRAKAREQLATDLRRILAAGAETTGADYRAQLRALAHAGILEAIHDRQHDRVRAKLLDRDLKELPAGHYVSYHTGWLPDGPGATS